jgi:protein involved in polysaccharide export with SLBB domain
MRHVRRLLRRCLPWAAALLPLSACGSFASLDEGEARAVETRVVEEEREYRIQPGDGLQIQFAHHPTRKVDVVVRPDGVVSIPLAEEVHVAGRTVPEVDDLLTKGVATTLRDPELTVIVLTMAKSMVFVGGEVGKPGPVPLVPGLTAFQALTAAGGIAPSGAADSVIVVRADGPGRRIVRRVSLAGADMLKNDVALGPFDIVFVPRTAIADVGMFVNNYINSIIPHSVSFTAFYNLKPGVQ